jgi:hypothetical protein
MKKYILYLGLLCGAMIALNACSNNDEDTTPSYADQNLFSPTAEDNSQTATLRRNFFNKVGSYLIFNDTLKHVQNGTDAYGNTLWNTETVDLEYSQLGTSNNYVYTFKYLTDYNAQLQAVQLLENKLTPRLGKAVPYSFLLVDSITRWDDADGDGELAIVSKRKVPYPTYVIGSRCYAVSLNGGKAFTDDTYFDLIFTQIVSDKLSHSSSEKLTKFYSYGEKYYGEYKDDLGYKLGYSDLNDSIAKTMGFWEDHNYDFFGVKKYDLQNFQNAIFKYSVAEVEQMYAGFPLVVEKFKLLREVVEEMGVVLDK